MIAGSEFALLHTIEDALPIGLTAVDKEGRQTYVNAAFCRMVGWNADELLGALPPFAYWPPEEAETLMKTLQAPLAGQTPSGGFSLRFRRRDETRLEVLVLPAPLKDAQGESVGRLMSVIDISERVRAEQTLREQEIAARRGAEEALQERSEEIARLNEAGRLLAGTLDPEQVYDRMRTLISGLMDCDSLLVSSYTPEDKMIRCVYARLDGQRVEATTFPPLPLAPEGRGMQSTVIRTGEPLCIGDMQKRVKTSNTTFHVDSEGMLRDKPIKGKPLTRSALMVPIKLEGRVLGIVQVLSHRKEAYTEEHLRILEALLLQVAAASRNAFLYQQAQKEITERRRIQMEAESLNAHLRQAMTETHHRVKNNLQIISAMIDMQLMEYGETIPSSELKRLNRHMQTLAGLHDLLTRQAKEDAQAQSIPGRAVFGKVLDVFREAAHPRALRLQVQDVLLSARHATALALVVNELISNALKHGAGDVEISFSHGDGKAVLAVDDGGPGFPADFDPAAAAHTGLELLDTAARWDLAGAIFYGNRPQGGAHVTVIFPLKS